MAESPSTTRLVTFEEAASIDADRHPGELDRGVWIPVTRNSWRHGAIVANVCVVLKQ
jgi:hypothetical protein